MKYSVEFPGLRTPKPGVARTRRHDNRKTVIITTSVYFFPAYSPQSCTYIFIQAQRGFVGCDSQLARYDSPAGMF